jgi:RNA-directed DNA polymerase
LFNDTELRLISINMVLKQAKKSKFMGIDEKVSLNFKGRFILQELLKAKWLNWKPQAFKIIKSVDRFRRVTSCKLFVIADQVWHKSLALLLTPVHQAVFHPRNVGFREDYSITDIQKIFKLNSSVKSGSMYKRILLVEFSSSFCYYNLDYLMSKIIANIKVKNYILTAINSGIVPEFIDETLNFSSLLANILLSGIEDIHPCVRFGSNIGFFLNPSDSERLIFKKLKKFIKNAGISGSLKQVKLKTLLNGVDFCGWNFTISLEGKFLSSPSFKEYQSFTQVIKNIINNSNYGAV